MPEAGYPFNPVHYFVSGLSCLLTSRTLNPTTNPLTHAPLISLFWIPTVFVLPSMLQCSCLLRRFVTLPCSHFLDFCLLPVGCVCLRTGVLCMTSWCLRPFLLPHLVSCVYLCSAPEETPHRVGLHRLLHPTRSILYSMQCNIITDVIMVMRC